MSVRVSKANLQSSVLVILQLFGNEVGFCFVYPIEVVVYNSLHIVLVSGEESY